MTEKELDAIEARAKNATPGPWPMPEDCVGDGRASGNIYYDPRRPVDHEGCDVWPWERREDMEFAYKAREDIPALVAEVRRLSGERFVCTSCGEWSTDCKCVQEEAVPWWKPGWTS